MCSDFFSEAHVLRYTEPLGYQSDQLISHHVLKLKIGFQAALVNTMVGLSVFEIRYFTPNLTKPKRMKQNWAPVVCIAFISGNKSWGSASLLSFGQRPVEEIHKIPSWQIRLCS